MRYRERIYKCAYTSRALSDIDFMRDEVMMTTRLDLPGYKVDQQAGLWWGILVPNVGFAKALTGAVTKNLTEILAYRAAVKVSPSA